MWRADLQSFGFQPQRHAGWCMVHRRAFSTLMGFTAQPDDCARYFDAHRAAFERAAADKIRRAHLPPQSNFHLTSRDVARARGVVADRQATA